MVILLVLTLMTMFDLLTLLIVNNIKHGGL